MPPLDNKTVLIVEDEPFIAFDLADAIADAGATVVGPALTVREAGEALDSDMPSLALLDINIGTDMVWPIAQRLHDRGVPFVFVSARCTQADLPAPFGAYQCISKPARQCDLVQSLKDLGGPGGLAA